MLEPFFAALNDLPWVALAAIAGSFVLAIIIVVGGLIFAHRRQALWHETARIALEKGQPLPPLPNERDEPQQPGPAPGPARDLRTGLICIGAGVGLFLFFDALLGRWMAYVGAIPGFVGLALLLFAILSLAFNRSEKSPSDRPPQS